MPSPSIALASASDLQCWFELMEQAEQAQGWVAWCRDHDIFVACTDEFVEAVAAELRFFSGTILEIGAGSGELAAELRERAVPVIATDSAPTGASVNKLNARDALQRYRPQTVLSSFLPVDTAIEADVLRFPSVRQYLYIGPVIMGRVGPHALWNVAGWNAKPLPNVDAVLISRLDVLPDFTRRTHQRGAGAVLLERI